MEPLDQLHWQNGLEVDPRKVIEGLPHRRLGAGKLLCGLTESLSAGAESIPIGLTVKPRQVVPPLHFIDIGLERLADMPPGVQRYLPRLDNSRNLFG
jgi:hypothetical protein